jgi:hypothetical protein
MKLRDQQRMPVAGRCCADARLMARRIAIGIGAGCTVTLLKRETTALGIMFASVSLKTTVTV